MQEFSRKLLVDIKGCKGIRIPKTPHNVLYLATSILSGIPCRGFGVQVRDRAPPSLSATSAISYSRTSLSQKHRLSDTAMDYECWLTLAHKSFLILLQASRATSSLRKGVWRELLASAPLPSPFLLRYQMLTPSLTQPPYVDRCAAGDPANNYIRCPSPKV